MRQDLLARCIGVSLFGLGVLLLSSFIVFIFMVGFTTHIGLDAITWLIKMLSA